MIRINLFSVYLSVRIAAMLLLSLLAGWVIHATDWIYVQVIIYTLIVLLVLDIYRILHKTNRDLERFLTAMKYGDFEVVISDKKMPKRYSQLLDLMVEIKENYQHQSQKGISNQSLIDAVTKTSEIGVVVLREGSAVLTSGINTEEFTSSELYEKVLHSRSGLSMEFRENPIDGFEFLKSQKIEIDGQDITIVVFSKNHQSGNEEFEAWVNFGKVFSHEILNSITPIASLSSSIKSMTAKIDDQSFATKINEALDVVLERCGSIQQFADKYRLLHRLPEPQLKPMNWKPFLEKTTGIFSSEIDQNGIVLIVEGDALEGAFSGDPEQLEQVFSNLIVNAIASMKTTSNRELRLSVTSTKHDFIVKVKDTGIGVAKENSGKLFVPFFTTKDEGSGIGLSVARQILWKHHADIRLTPTESGAEFTIKYPKIFGKGN